MALHSVPIEVELDTFSGYHVSQILYSIPLESGQSIVQTKGHLEELIRAHWSDESCLLLIFSCN